MTPESGAPLGPTGEGENPYQSPAASDRAADAADPWRMSEQLMVGAAGVLLMLLSLVAPGLGIPLAAFIYVPAAIRMVGIRNTQLRQGVVPDLAQRAHWLLTSLLVVTTILASAMIAFVAICFPTGFLAFSSSQGGARTSWIFGAGLLVGGVAGVAVFYFLGRKLWPWRGGAGRNEPTPPRH
jgi:hypothetical protein